MSEETAGAPSPTLAQKLAAWHVARKGYRPGTVPEAEPLLAAADQILTYSDGLAFSILCLVDREANPGRRFGLDRERLLDIGEACLGYSGRVSGAKLPIGISVVELGPGLPSPEDEARLRALGTSRWRAKVKLSGWAVDSSARRLWPRGLWRRVGLRRLVETPGRLERELGEPTVVPALPERRFPLAATALLACFALVFAGEQLVRVRPGTGFLTPDVATLIGWGGLSRDLVMAGEGYRLLTSAFLHADPMHLFFNGVAFAMAAFFLEAILGPAWFAAIFFGSAVGGGLVSVAAHADQVSVGASGGILGLVVAALVVSRRLPAGAPRARVQTGMLQVLVPSLIPAFSAAANVPVDLAAHLGGGAAGALLGLLLLATWRPERPRPPMRPFAAAACLAAVGVLGWGALASARAFPALVAETQLVPEDRISDLEAAVKQSADLVRDYPHDPRAHLVRALAYGRAQQPEEAEAELRTGLGERLLREVYKPALEVGMRTMLGRLLLSEDRKPEAVQAVAPACGLGKNGGVPKDLEPLGLCPAR